MTLLRGHGLALTVRRGWEARIWLPDAPPPAENRPVMRLANFALPSTKDTYAEDVVDELRQGQVVASLVEFAPRLAERGLYAPQGVPAFDLERPRSARRAASPAGASGAAAVLLRGRACVQFVRDRPRRRWVRATLRELQTQLFALVVEPA